MYRRPPRFTPTATHFPYTRLFRARGEALAGRHSKVARCAVRVDGARAVSHPALDDGAVGGHEAAHGVEVEGAGAGVEGLVALADGEEAVALDRQVGGPTGQLRGALREGGRDAGQDRKSTRLNSSH